MIEPESFSDSHQAFKYFRKVTDPVRFLRSKGIVPPRWPLVLCLAALPVMIWIVHFLVTGSVFVMALRKELSLLMSYLYWGTIPWMVVVVTCIWFKSRWIKRALKDKGIPVKGWNWFGPEVQLLMLQEFTDYLIDKGFYNPEALHQLIESTRDDIESLWRPLPVILTLVTLALALLIAYYQPVFSEFLQIARTSDKEITLLAQIGVLVFTPMFLYGYIFYASFFSRFRRERAIFMHGLSNTRLSLLRRE